MSSIAIRESSSITRDIMMTDPEGNSRQMALVSGSVQPGRSWSVNVTVVDAVAAAQNKEELGAAVDACLAEIRQRAMESGMPV